MNREDEAYLIKKNVQLFWCVHLNTHTNINWYCTFICNCRSRLPVLQKKFGFQYAHFDRNSEIYYCCRMVIYYEYEHITKVYILSIRITRFIWVSQFLKIFSATDSSRENSKVPVYVQHLVWPDTQLTLTTQLKLKLKICFIKVSPFVVIAIK